MTSHKFARFISTIFVPPSFNLILFSYFAFKLENTSQKIFSVIAVSFIFGFALNIILFFYLKRKGKITDLDASVQEERTIPFLLSIIFYLTGLSILFSFKVNIIITAFWSCYITTTLLILIINKYWKLSAHVAGVSGPLAAVLFVTPWLSLFFFVILLAIGWARLKLRCHNIYQVIAGFSLGFFVTLIQMFLILSI